MTAIAPPPTSRHIPSPRRRFLARHTLTSWPGRRVLVVLIAATGIAVLLFPMTMNWFSDRAHRVAIDGYAQSVHALTPQAARAELHAAHAYNRHLPAGMLRDPYTQAPPEADSDPGYARYQHLLDIGPGGIMATLTVPSIGVFLPIYHGTSPQTLDLGIGHLFGSSLPVGGLGTHSVLTGHSGVVGKTLLTNLDKVHLGDTFTITVLDRTLTYGVDQIRTVLPTDTKALQVEPGKDYVTLVTCTPIGINSHRLLVRGVRIPSPATGDPTETIAAKAQHGSFPWWIILGACSLLVLTIATGPLGHAHPPSGASPADHADSGAKPEASTPA